ncbi:MAG TPA: hypothetical protein ENK18_10490 [Deltaproteobacteria bacterium]|nr:hypothetical protein [Deltaproteobacteria bacterium]
MWILTTMITAMAAEPAPGKPAKIEGKTEDEWGFSTGDEISIDTEEDDIQMVDFVAESKRQPPAPAHLHLYPQGKQPLADDWALYVASYNEHYVVGELPVLVATDRASFTAAHPGGLLLVGEWRSGNHTLVIEQRITAEAVLPSSPTFVFLRAAMPNTAPVGDLRVFVRTGELPAPPGPGATPPAAPPLKDRYARTTVYTRK